MSSVTPSTPKGEENRRTSKQDALRAARFAAQRALHQESSLERVRACGWRLNGECADRVAVKLSGGLAGFSGLQTCGSPWACPVCSQKIMAQRAEDVQAAVTRWHSGHEIDGAKIRGRVVFATFTMRHRADQSLADLWESLSYAWGRVTSGSQWVADSERFGVVLPRVVKTGHRKGQTLRESRINFVRAVEVTHGKNGWHVHIHALLFVKDGITDLAESSEVSALADSMFIRWSEALVASGLEAPTRENGIDVRLVRRADSKALGDYFTKNVYVGRVRAVGAGWEIAGGQGKTARGKNRTPFQILSDVVATGDADDLDRWHEFEAASFGRRQMTWSNTLRSLLELHDEKTDQEVAEEDLSGEIVCEFLRADWYNGLCWQKARILELVEKGCDAQLILSILLPDPGRRAA